MMLKSISWKKILTLGVLLRFIVMPFLFHPDIKTYNFQASFLKTGVFDIYSYLVENRSSLPLKEEFVYFPLTYFFLGGYQVLAQPALGEGFTQWLADASQSAVTNTHIFRYLFILKIPYLLLDLAVGLLLYSMFSKEDKKKKALLLWLFNPFSILIIYGFSNLDIIIVSLVMGSLFLAQKEKLGFSALLLGLGAGFKAYPLLFIPFLFLSGRSIKQKMEILLISLVPFLLVLVPFMKSSSFRESTLTSGLMTRLTVSGVNLGFNETLLLGMTAFGALFFWGLSGKYISSKDLWRYYLALMLVVISFIHFHIQWLLWFFPLLVIAIVNSNRLTSMAVSLILTALLIPLLYEDKAMTVGLLSVISPMYNLIPIPFTIVQKIYDPSVLQSILHSVFAGGSLVFIWQLFKVRQDE